MDIGGCVMSEWSPIKLAPYDGTVILIAYPDGFVAMGSRRKASHISRDELGPFDGYDFSSHNGRMPIAWQPVPFFSENLEDVKNAGLHRRTREEPCEGAPPSKAESGRRHSKGRL